MIKHLNKLDTFNQNIILVFAGTLLLNFLNLLYQLLLAHQLPPAEFAAFTSLLSIFMVVSSPLSTFQPAIAKYIAEYNARNDRGKIRVLLSGLFKRTSLLALVTFFVFCLISFYLLAQLKISSLASGYILALLLAVSWIIPVAFGGVQGLELFKWLAATSVAGGIVKLALAALFIWLGLGVAGALGALLLSSVIGILLLLFPLRGFIVQKSSAGGVDFKGFFLYLLPIAVATFCFMALVSFDMVMVKYFFPPVDSGFYSLAQMIGKIFLFLPVAISLVMFPRTAGLNARKMDTAPTLKRSLFYGAILCVIAVAVYNIFPEFILKVLTGKAFPESVYLGRLFSISMSFFTLLNIMILYFLSVKDLRFMKYLVIFTGLQFSGIILFHQSLAQVQGIVCANAVILFFVHLILVNTKPSAA